MKSVVVNTCCSLSGTLSSSSGRFVSGSHDSGSAKKLTHHVEIVYLENELL